MLICGIDEAGRGCLAGPVCAAAVILPDTFDISILDDSKKLSEAKRELARKVIMQSALFYHVGWATPEEIDTMNILRATMTAMERAFEGIMQAATASHTLHDANLRIIVDGNRLPDINTPYTITAEPKADARYPAVMAASILAKTSRDRLMYKYHLEYPQYRYDAHKGYGTALHRACIEAYGPSPIQRLSFKIKGMPS